MTLASGGCLCIAPQSVMMDDLAGTINIFNVNFLETTPAVIALIEPDDVPTLCTLYSGGEPLTKAVRDKWSSRVTLGNVVCVHTARPLFKIGEYNITNAFNVSVRPNRNYGLLYLLHSHIIIGSFNYRKTVRPKRGLCPRSENATRDYWSCWPALGIRQSGLKRICGPVRLNVQGICVGPIPRRVL